MARAAAPLEAGVDPIRAHSTSLALLLCLCLGSVACDQGSEQAVSPRSTVSVKLPPTPDLNAKIPPMRHPGGVWTIEGVLRSTTELSGSTVEVRGVVVSAHSGEPCHPPAHFYLADRADEERYQLLVTGTESRIVDMARAGLELTLRGRLDVMSEGGAFIRQAGVLVLPSTENAAPSAPAAQGSPGGAPSPAAEERSPNAPE